MASIGGQLRGAQSERRAALDLVEHHRETLLGLRLKVALVMGGTAGPYSILEWLHDREPWMFQDDTEDEEGKRS